MPSHIRQSKIEAKLIELFGHENSLKDIIIAAKFAKLFGDAQTQNKSIIRDSKILKNQLIVWSCTNFYKKKIKR